MHPNLDIHFSLDPIDQTLTCKYRVFLNPTSMGIKEWKGGFTIDHCQVDIKEANKNVDESARKYQACKKVMMSDAFFAICIQQNQYQKCSHRKMYNRFPQTSSDPIESQQFEAISFAYPNAQYKTIFDIMALPQGIVSIKQILSDSRYILK